MNATNPEYTAIPFSRSRESDRRAWAKYVLRGWTMLNDNENADYYTKDYSLGVRRFAGDSVSWKLPLSVGNLGLDGDYGSYLDHSGLLSVRDNERDPLIGLTISTVF